MKKFKIIDFWISIVFIATFSIVSLIKLDNTFLIGYFVVGGWQIISMIIHTVKGWFVHHKTGRYYYECIVVILAALTLIGFFVYPVLFYVMTFLLYASPLMAIYYTRICYDEVYHKMQRPLALLK